MEPGEGGRWGPSKDHPSSALACLPPNSSFFSCFLQNIRFELSPVPTILGAEDPELIGPLLSLQGWGCTRAGRALEKEGVVCPGALSDLRKMLPS